MNDITTHEGAGFGLSLQLGGGAALPLALQMYFNPTAFQAAQEIALKMSKAGGFMPEHLLGKPDACFAVVEISLNWRLSPFQVGKATYRTPGGSIGFEGKLIQAIIENSGHLEPGSGGVKREYYGDWSKIQAKFTKKKSEKGNEYFVPTWTDEDAVKGACGVRVSALMRGEREPRSLDFDLVQAQPRNSTLWATDAKTQLWYAAVRRFGSTVVPGLLMGVPFDDGAGGERDMGNAEVIEQEAPVRTPERREAAAAPATPWPGAHPNQANPPSGEELVKAAKAAVETAETVDRDTGEVQRQEAAPALITERALGVLRSQLADKELTEDFCKRYGIADPSELPMSKVNEALQWVQAQKGGK